jgi:hypothetical protein
VALSSRPCENAAEDVTFIAALSDILLIRNVMAVEAVPSEPLSRLDSLLSGINTGKFRTVVRLTDWDYSSTLLNPSDFF